MDKEMKALLQAAAVTGRLPIVRFELRSSKDRELISTALRDVWMTGPRQGAGGADRRGGAGGIGAGDLSPAGDAAAGLRAV